MATQEEKERARKRREKIKDLIEEVGLWNLNKGELAKQHYVSNPIITKDIKFIIKKWLREEDIEVIRINISTGYKKAIRECMSTMTTGNKSEKLNAARTLKTLSDGFTDMLEKFGLKRKIPEQIDIRGQVKELSLKEDFAEFKKIYDGNKKEE